ncbi:ferredoxin [Pisolithus orientalis]|uniref:ferredoxin n=1 Tax=Pisolithus orientalis TaxID=936130 RepID=UPI002223EF06|nr:ferredoxin [Pisolithus orientalis]KAI6015249.1 ferredoxin [Pisolithus orientalis]
MSFKFLRQLARIPGCIRVHAPPLAQSTWGTTYRRRDSSRYILRRYLHGTPIRQHGQITRPEPGTGIKLHFKDHKGNPIKTIEAREGDDILSLAHEWDIDLEGACEGSIACSTCHVILQPETYDTLPEPSDDENDMLDLAFGLTDTSRLGCQVQVTKEMDGTEIRLPSATRNMFVDGKKPTHH